MFQKLIKMVVSGGYRVLQLKGADCPECGEKLDLPAKMPEEGYDAVLACQYCEWMGSIGNMIKHSRGDYLAPKNRKPQGSSILKSLEGDTHTWLIPPKRRLNFLMFFAAFWLLVTGVITGVALVGGMTDASTGESGGVGILLLLIPFWLIGLTIGYIGLRLSFTELILRVNGEEVVLLRKFGRRVWAKKIARESVGSVLIKVAYKQNNNPVYQVVLTNRDGRDIKFGSGLKHDEKRWLLGQMQKALHVAPEVKSVHGVVTSQTVGNLPEHEGKGLVIKRMGRGEFCVTRKYFFGKWLVFAGCVALVVAGFVFLGNWESYSYSNSESGEGGLWFFSSLMDAVGLFVPLLVGLVAMVLVVVGYRAMGRVVVFEFNRSGVVVITRWRGSRQKKSYKRDEFLEVKRTNNGHVNDDPRFKVVLMGSKRSLTLCGYENDSASMLLEKWLGTWLKQEGDVSGYGRPMDI